MNKGPGECSVWAAVHNHSRTVETRASTGAWILLRIHGNITTATQSFNNRLESMWKRCDCRWNKQKKKTQKQDYGNSEMRALLSCSKGGTLLQDQRGTHHDHNYKTFTFLPSPKDMLKHVNFSWQTKAAWLWKAALCCCKLLLIQWFPRRGIPTRNLNLLE